MKMISRLHAGNPPTHRTRTWSHQLPALLASAVLGLGFPLLLSLLLRVPVPLTFSLVTSTLVIEYGTAAVGLALGLAPGYVIAVMTVTALSIILFSFCILDALGERSQRVARFVERAQRKYGSSRVVQRYGIYALIFGAITVGLYVCIPIAWILGWDRRRSILLLMLGFLLGAAGTLLAALGVLGALLLA